MSGRVELVKLQMKPYLPYVFRLWYDAPETKHSQLTKKDFLVSSMDVWTADTLGEEGAAEAIGKYNSGKPPVACSMIIAKTLYAAWQAASLKKDSLIAIVKKTTQAQDGETYPYWEFTPLNNANVGCLFSTLDYARPISTESKLEREQVSEAAKHEAKDITVSVDPFAMKLMELCLHEADRLLLERTVDGTATTSDTIKLAMFLYAESRRRMV